MVFLFINLEVLSSQSINRYPPTHNPDRINLTVTENPSTSASVTWRTDTSVKIASAQIVLASANPTSVNDARNLNATNEVVISKNGSYKTLHWDGDTSGTVVNVVGVVNDYVYGDMYGKPDPVMFFCVNLPNASNMYLRLKPNVNTEKAIQQIATVLKKDNPSYPFTYHFVDDQFNQMFQNEQLISKLSRVFATLAIIISCLGLFGLAAYTAERRTKEIGVRKVLGASVTNITTLLSKDFLQLVFISCLVSFPLAWWMMHSWLQNYKYRIDISWWIFVAAGISAIVIALITISFQSVKAALSNPVKSLRSE